jgi:hypothetical protein
MKIRTETLQTDEPLKIGLSLHQRNILHYYYNHKRKNPNSPCFAPRMSACDGRRDVYFKALDALERHKYLVIDRSAPNYTGWILKEHPQSPVIETSSPFT